MSYNMVCRDMQYHLGTLYIKTGQIDLCHSGYHFCKNLKDVFKYYPDTNGNRFFEVEAGGTVITGKDKCVASTLRIVRELDRKEICRIKYGDSINTIINTSGQEFYWGYDDVYKNRGDGRTFYWDTYSVGEPKQYGCNSDGNGTGNGELFTFGNGEGYGSGVFGNNIQKILVYI